MAGTWVAELAEVWAGEWAGGWGQWGQWGQSAWGQGAGREEGWRMQKKRKMKMKRKKQHQEPAKWLVLHLRRSEEDEGSMNS